MSPRTLKHIVTCISASSLSSCSPTDSKDVKDVFKTNEASNLASLTVSYWLHNHDYQYWDNFPTSLGAGLFPRQNYYMRCCTQFDAFDYIIYTEKWWAELLKGALKNRHVYQLHNKKTYYFFSYAWKCI